MAAHITASHGPGDLGPDQDLRCTRPLGAFGERGASPRWTGRPPPASEAADLPTCCVHESWTRGKGAERGCRNPVGWTSGFHPAAVGRGRVRSRPCPGMMDEIRALLVRSGLVQSRCISTRSKAQKGMHFVRPLETAAVRSSVPQSEKGRRLLHRPPITHRPI
ncbi:hypothetical protein LZ31DRAFT_216639 [Colletotrichum somersetense]|nr:hypothetical protein LZ31DRAFT_216639 [Colletotrichum somersetense]